MVEVAFLSLAFISKNNLFIKVVEENKNDIICLATYPQ